MVPSGRRVRQFEGSYGGGAVKRFAELKGATPGDLPAWLKKASIQEAIVEVDDRGRVIWKDGVWLSGTWRGHVWQGGVWKGGTWESGSWINGFWVKGEWKGGTWTDGVWMTGFWRDGIWKGGIWYDGTWADGIWKGGKWINGVWGGGEWCGGRELGTREMCVVEADEEDEMPGITIHHTGEAPDPSEASLKKLLGKRSAPAHLVIDAEGKMTSLTAEMDKMLEKVSTASKEALEDKRAAARAEKKAIVEATKKKIEKSKPKNFETSDDLAAHLFGE